MAIRLRLDPITGTGTLEGISLEDIAGMDEAIALINQRLDEIEMTLQTVTNQSLGISWVTITDAAEQAAKNTGYWVDVPANISPIITLPVEAPVGSVIKVVGRGQGLWTIAQNALQEITFGNKNTKIGVDGQLKATHERDSVSLICCTNTRWVVEYAIGELFLVEP